MYGKNIDQNKRGGNSRPFRRNKNREAYAAPAVPNTQRQSETPKE
jgi:hypothetical protein